MTTKIDLTDVKPGMVLAENIYLNDRLFLAKGTIMKSSYISRLKTYKIRQIKINEIRTPHREIYQTNPVEEFYEKTYVGIKKTFNEIVKNQKINVSHIFPIVESILEAVYINQDSILLLTGYKRVPDSYFHAHSLDVCIYSLIIAKAMGLNYYETVNLGMGAFFHDIGKIKVPQHILNKQEPLSVKEFEEVKKHSFYGFQMLNEFAQIDPVIPIIILEHHERLDGSGYPLKRRESEIHKLSKIVAVADVYDALTSDRVYKKKVLPHEAAEYFLSDAGNQFDSAVINILLKNIAIYPKGCQVLLSTNAIAVVIDSNRAQPLRPIIKIITDKNRNPLSDPVILDLEINFNIKIIQIFS